MTTQTTMLTTTEPKTKCLPRPEGGDIILIITGDKAQEIRKFSSFDDA